MDCIDHALCSFTSNISCYFSRNPNLTRCSLVKRHTSNLSINGDFSLPLNFEAWRKHIDSIILAKFNRCSNDIRANSPSSLSSETILHVLLLEFKEDCCFKSDLGDVDEDLHTILQYLIEESKFWPLCIDRCRIQKNRLHLYLNRVHAFKAIVHTILTKQHAYGRSQSPLLQSVQVTAEDLPDFQHATLGQWRAHLVANALSRVLDAAGHHVEDAGVEQTNLRLHVTSCPSDLPPGEMQILCGPAVADGENNKDLVGDFIRGHQKTLLETASLRSNSADPDVLSMLSSSAVAIELLGVKPSHKVTLGPGNMCTKAALSVHYNCARLASIHALFKQKVAEGTYPSLIPVQDVDFSLLGKEDEWELLFNFLLTFPDVLQSCVDRASEGSPAPHLICNFLKTLCYSYSRYYRRVRILVEPRDHLLPVMFARLYLNLAIEQVLHNALGLLDITPATAM